MRILLAPRTLAATLSVAAAFISPQCLPHCARSRPVAGAGGARAPARRVPSLRSPPAVRAAAAALAALVLAPARLPQRPGERVAGDGGVAVRTCCDVAAGEPLTICYGAKELVGWDVAKRRAYLEQHNGFFCRCVRCELEGAS